MPIGAVVVVVTALLVGSVPAARTTAAAPYGAMDSARALTTIFIGNDSSCQVQHAGESAFELYAPSVIAGDFGMLRDAVSGYRTGVPYRPSRAAADAVSGDRRVRGSPKCG